MNLSYRTRPVNLLEIDEARSEAGKHYDHFGQLLIFLVNRVSFGLYYHFGIKRFLSPLF